MIIPAYQRQLRRWLWLQPKIRVSTWKKDPTTFLISLWTLPSMKGSRWQLFLPRIQGYGTSIKWYQMHEVLYSSLLYAKHQDCLQIVETHSSWPTPQPSTSTCGSMWVQGTAPRLKLLHIDIHLFRAGCVEDVWRSILWPRRPRDLLLEEERLKKESIFGNRWQFSNELVANVLFDHSEVVEVRMFHQLTSITKTCLLFKVFNPLFSLEQTWCLSGQWIAENTARRVLVMDTLRLQNYPIKSRRWHNLLSTSIFASPFFQKFQGFSHHVTVSWRQSNPNLLSSNVYRTVTETI